VFTFRFGGHGIAAARTARVLQPADMLCAAVRRAVVSATAFVVAVLTTSTREARAQAPCVSSFPTAPIHVSSDKAVVLQLREGHRKYRTLCAAPCDVEVPIDATYRVAGDGIRASEDFVLRATCGEPVSLDVDASSKAAFIGGMVTASVGTATVCSAFLHLVLAGYSTSCGAGRTLIGIEADGTIKGCPSLPTATWAGGNVRDHSIADIWERAKPLRYTRDRTADDLWGFCRNCYYADTCRAGCTWTSDVFFGKPGNNPYCHHRALEHERMGKRERLVPVELPPGTPFDHGRFDVIVEDLERNDP
jgi:radical SAM protein with 4Fe4S-binding SPASM domain